MIFDTHSHCYWDSLKLRIDDIIANMDTHSVMHATQIWCDVESSEKAIALARRFPGRFFATVWYHPEEAQDNGDYSYIGKLEKLIHDYRDIVVAVGECGFDYHYLDGSDGGKIPVDMTTLSDRAKEQIEHQKNWWLIQWEIAQKYDLPLVIHTRDARDATLAFMKEHDIYRVVMHCFSEDWDFARELLEFSDDIYFSFSGIVTYKNALKIQEAASKIPLNRILIETDAPFLAPQPVRGSENEPAYVRYVLDKIISLRDEVPEEIERVIYENSLRFYGI